VTRVPLKPGLVMTSFRDCFWLQERGLAGGEGAGTMGGITGPLGMRAVALARSAASLTCVPPVRSVRAALTPSKR
jgi:hypothetical protein